MIQDRTCQTCGTVFQGGPRAYYCPVCRAERRKISEARCHQRQREGKTRVGTQDACERCGAVYTVNAGLQRFCKACQKDHAKEYDRKTGLEFYRRNREKINPIRMVRRRKGPAICVICGKEFKAPTCTTTCSPECRRKARNSHWKLKYYPQSRKNMKSENDKEL